MDKAPAFRIGDKVTVHSSQSGPQTLATVARFTHDNRCMELSDGSQWRADGRRQWGFRGSFYKGPVVQAEAEGDADFIAKRRAIGAIRKFANDLGMDSPLTAAQVQRILAAINAERAAAGEAEGDRD
ncbi:hypothetical protein [Azospirillum thermophilum]|uniref:Uncharacterized protein n=1 Tax=Azospirillum thermophilum TaxID=2202148 RepID=A0A2S2CWQ2_9PROT|nr:hypothetical protein [Azospirillum thermophilum]AWK88953.1 hypothetical protein DEW08_23225 [Azospirillum thermophilum]